MQASLFGLSAPSFDAGFQLAVRKALPHGAWIEHAPQWLSGHQSLFEQLAPHADWHHQRRQMYDREVDVPRLVARVPESGPGSALLIRVSHVLSRRYGVVLDSISLALYRDGHDSVAPHGDKMGPLRNNTVIGILSVGEPRRFILRSVDTKTRLLFSLGWGDLLVMGGTCQESFLHGVPKVKHAGPRMSIQFRESLPNVAKAFANNMTESKSVRYRVDGLRPEPQRGDR